MTEPAGGPSWDSERHGAPARPAHASSLSTEPPLPRPRRVVVALWLVVAAAVAFLVVTALAALRLDEVRDAVTAALPESVEVDYSSGEIRRAVHVLIAAVGGLGLLLTLAQVLSMRSLAARRSSTGRIVFVTVVVLYLPVAAVAPAIREGGRGDDALSIAGVLCLLVAVVLVCCRPVSAWLRQAERREPLPLVPPDEAGPQGDGEVTRPPRSADPSDPAAPR